MSQDAAQFVFMTCRAGAESALKQEVARVEPAWRPSFSRPGFLTFKNTGEGQVDATLAIVFSADDGCDVGEDSGAPVSPDYGSRGNGFNGIVKGVQLAIADAAESVDHLMDPENAIRLAMARQ